MTNRIGIPRAIAAFAAAFALCALAAATASALPAPLTSPGDPLDPRTYAPASTAFLVAHAEGVQKYACRPDGTWLFTDPEATLYATTPAGIAIGEHFLDFATGRPAWRLRDGSLVQAARWASGSGGSGNIAWLLLRSAATAPGADGDRLASTTWVQRLNTAGGTAPAGTCSPGDRIGVPYSADYMFWRAAGGEA